MPSTSRSSRREHFPCPPLGESPHDLALYRVSPLVRHDVPVRGFVYDVRTGKLREVQS